MLCSYIPHLFSELNEFSCKRSALNPDDAFEFRSSRRKEGPTVRMKHVP